MMAAGLHLVLADAPLWLLVHGPPTVFLFCFGACVGSFVNVVVYRLPAGMSVISPPSRCPTCGARLRFFRENLPILGWFMIRGRCRYCGVRVSPQYMVIELVMALIFVALYAMLFVGGHGTSWWHQIGGDWWTANGIYRAWPAYFTLAFLVAGLVAMTLIDARTMTIPIEIPVFVTVTAFIAYPLQSILPTRGWASSTWPIPGVTWPWFGAGVGAAIGIAIGMLLLKLGKLRYSFHDYDEHVEPDSAIGDYPHARREMGVEILFLLPCLLGGVLGYLLGRQLPATAPPELVQAIGGSLLGYLSGGALIWGIRILGTLGFGREAMGLGDVHLLGAVGAVLGWFDPILIFFIAPFSGILGVLLSMGLSSVFKISRRELPYGPHLAVATIIVLVGRPALEQLRVAIMPGVPWPTAGLVHTAPTAQRSPVVEPGADPRADNLALGSSVSWAAVASRSRGPADVAGTAEATDCTASTGADRRCPDSNERITRDAQEAHRRVLCAACPDRARRVQVGRSRPDCLAHGGERGAAGAARRSESSHRGSPGRPAGS
jgi:leader peptidase (prepilin peptidase)/N-methyltransferase